MSRRSGVCVLVFILVLLVRVEIAGAFSGVLKARHYGRMVPVPPLYQRAGPWDQDQDQDQIFTRAYAQSHARIAKVMPSALLGSHFWKVPQDHSGLRTEEHGVQVQDPPVSARHIVTMEQKNGIELYVSSEQMGVSEPVSSEEVMRSLNINTLHHSLQPFGITQVSSEKNVLQDQHERDVWNKEGFYVVVIFLTIFIIIVTCLMVLYRLKEKVEHSEQQVKASGPVVRDVPLTPVVRDVHLTPVVRDVPLTPVVQDVHLTPVVRDVHLTSVATHGSQPPVILSSMVQASLVPQQSACNATSTSTSTCVLSSSHTVLHRDTINPHTHTRAPVLTCNSEHQSAHGLHSHPGPHGPPGPPTTEIRPCFSSSPSPFKMKPAAGLQERRGSNVSLVLDMSTLGCVEPLSCSVTSPREHVAQEYLHSASRVLSRQQLRDVALNAQALQVEFAEIPMNFVDPKDLDIPSHGTKNRYKTILPNPHSRVVLKSRNTNDPLSCYINANYIRGYLREEKAYIATQGPMINTVNDFWQMAWQENCPVIVMVTKLKEKNEKCVLYWPEKRGIYGKVEVLVSGVRECEHYTVRSLTLKQSGVNRKVQHYWYTSWPDHKTPDSAGPLLQLMSDVEAAREALDPSGPVVVHCSAGIGRTGCFIATTIGCHQLRLEGVVDVLSIVCQLRADRGGMIQTEEQYEFVHHALSLYESRLSAEAGQ
ncbi:receptor-type tyrosine-protein phosphatase R isoform X2 [Brachyhypopomus gauderio]|uniref:receptor-type tyrosine-protein phosphatase R isoform X2 n=1 Tax=Brachyhypopomus gauderio TaxID=698409 RepID=UPI004041A3C1